MNDLPDPTIYENSYAKNELAEFFEHWKQETFKKLFESRRPFETVQIQLISSISFYASGNCFSLP